ncbi:hypothetical protein AvCA_33950 [Azotobacter vinelandii CA]|uniref:Uncharacterized protein n=2 Tax=Azotobacter vinelandii TaxID=354 RepID=C1DPX4_AZOVD|nr:hypothetical protein Avin_33950 [Azotobacter vinelandii DJ]AGK14649.1 hypothetical protein AvCA_33950 [Azotobacter vinelandii CA]AGK21312.1 hypothetical protein AvCA6_33950 [Azotobacter vinelandii CA6]
MQHTVDAHGIEVRIAEWQGVDIRLQKDQRQAQASGAPVRRRDHRRIQIDARYPATEESGLLRQRQRIRTGSAAYIQEVLAGLHA